jgi:hypothetical protein
VENDDIGVSEAATLCGIPPRTVRYMCSKGEWSEQAYQVTRGKKKEWRIPEAVVRIWIEEHPVVTVDADQLPDMVAPPAAVAPTPEQVAEAVETKVREVIRQEVATALDAQREEMTAWMEERFGPIGKRAGIVARIKAMLNR